MDAPSAQRAALPAAPNISSAAETTAREHQRPPHTSRRTSERYNALSVAPSSPATQRPDTLRRSSSVLSDFGASSPVLARKASTTSLRNTEVPSSPRSVSRRASAHLLNSPSISARSPLAPQMEENLPSQATAASVAAEYFRKELELHEDERTSTQTVVILHDACYGHRYSRPKTSKSMLSMIVERPERIHAGVLGITAAYVRMGGRYAGGTAAPHPLREPEAQLPFKIRRTARAIPITSTYVTNVHGTQWMTELRTMCDNAEQKLATTGKELTRMEATTTKTSGLKPKQKLHEGDLYLCPASLGAFEGALGGVCDGVDAVFNAGNTPHTPSTAFVCVRPPGHHCSADFPSGFCWINNVHVGIEYATQMYGLTHAAIIDFDLHHGDGSQSITWDHNAKVSKMPQKWPQSKKTAIGYFSLHDINSYPCEEGDQEKVQNASICIENAHGQNIWNVHLQPWKTEAEFWNLYDTRYNVLLDKARSFLRNHTQRLQSSPNMPKPKSAIFLSAGFDASEWEGQGMQRHKVNVPTEFYARLTADVVKLSKEEGLAAEGRIISVLEGGYSDRALTSGVLSHLSGLCHDQVAILEDTAEDKGRLAQEMGLAMSRLALEAIGVNPVDDEKAAERKPKAEYHYDASWWLPSHLAELEELSNPSLPAPKKAARSSEAPTYFSPTQSFAAKVVDPTKIRTSSGRFFPSRSPSRAPTPPPPEVDWATAAYELHKLLVPGDRETRSCRPEQLSEPKAKKARQSEVGTIPTAATHGGRQLRDRKAKAIPQADGVSDSESVTSKRSMSDASRRRTIADFPLVTSNESTSIRNRRLSVASTVSNTSGVVARKPNALVGPKSGADVVEVKKTRGRPSSSLQAVPATRRMPSDKNRSTHKPNIAARDALPKVAKDDGSILALISGIDQVHLADPTDAASSSIETSHDTMRVGEQDNIAAAAALKSGPRLKITNKAAEEADRKKAVAAERAAPRKTAMSKSAVPRAPKTGPGANKVVSTGGEVKQAISNRDNTEATTQHHPVPSPNSAPVIPTTPSAPLDPHKSPEPAPLNDLGSGSSKLLLTGASSESTNAAITSSPTSTTADSQFVQYLPTRPLISSSVSQDIRWLPPNSDPAIADAAKMKSSVAIKPESEISAKHDRNGAPLSPTLQPLAGGGSSNVEPKPAQKPLMRPNHNGQPMPVFTSNSPIPFSAATTTVRRDGAAEVQAGGSSAEADLKNEAAKALDIWEVPETPLK